jgi:bacterioferritin-associated ferredoxin
VYICLCAAVTDRQIREFCEGKSSTTFPEVCRNLNIARQCGRCAEAARAAAGIEKKPLVSQSPQRP